MKRLNQEIAEPTRGKDEAIANLRLRTDRVTLESVGQPFKKKEGRG